MSVGTVVIQGIPVFGEGVQPQVGAPQDPTGNSAVNLVSLTAVYVGGQLQVSASVEPVDPEGSIVSLIVAATPPEKTDVICASDNVLYGNGSAAGLTVGGLAFTALWSPATWGDQILATVNGLVMSGGQMQPYGWSRLLTVEIASNS